MESRQWSLRAQQTEGDSMDSTTMETLVVGRAVTTPDGKRGTVTRWEPYGIALCDALVKHDDGSVCWYGSHVLKPESDARWPNRQEARTARTAEHLRQMAAIADRWEKEPLPARCTIGRAP